MSLFFPFLYLAAERWPGSTQTVECASRPGLRFFCLEKTDLNLSELSVSVAKDITTTQWPARSLKELERNSTDLCVRIALNCVCVCV